MVDGGDGGGDDHGGGGGQERWPEQLLHTSILACRRRGRLHARPHVEQAATPSSSRRSSAVSTRASTACGRELLLVACVRRKQPNETPAAHLCADLRGEVGERGRSGDLP